MCIWPLFQGSECTTADTKCACARSAVLATIRAYANYLYQEFEKTAAIKLSKNVYLFMFGSCDTGLLGYYQQIDKASVCGLACICHIMCMCRRAGMWFVKCI